METTDYCSYELSKALKACGFDEPCYFYYTREYAPEDHVWSTTSEEAPIDYNKSVYAGCSMPTLAQAQKWLREKQKIDVLVYNCACGYAWDVSRAMNGTGLILYDEKGDDENSGCWTSYEAALSAGIETALELIIPDNNEKAN